MQAIIRSSVLYDNRQRISAETIILHIKREVTYTYFKAKRQGLHFMWSQVSDWVSRVLRVFFPKNKMLHQEISTKRFNKIIQLSYPIYETECAKHQIRMNYFFCNYTFSTTQASTFFLTFIPSFIYYLSALSSWMLFYQHR